MIASASILTRNLHGTSCTRYQGLDTHGTRHACEVMYLHFDDASGAVVGAEDEILGRQRYGFSGKIMGIWGLSLVGERR